MVRSFATGNSDSQLIIQIENMNNFLIAMGKSCYTLHSFVVMHDSSKLVRSHNAMAWRAFVLTNKDEETKGTSLAVE